MITGESPQTAPFPLSPIMLARLGPCSKGEAGFFHALVCAPNPRCRPRPGHVRAALSVLRGALGPAHPQLQSPSAEPLELSGLREKQRDFPALVQGHDTATPS